MKKPKHPWWHWFFTKWISHGTRSKSFGYSHFIRYRCIKCDKYWEDVWDEYGNKIKQGDGNAA